MKKTEYNILNSIYKLDLLSKFYFSLVTAFRVIENVSEKYFEEGFGTETTQENESTTQKLPRNYPETTRERLLNLIASNPGLTRKELAKLLGITSNGVKYHIQKLTDENIIKREGSDRAGKWVIL
jgi:ATP-dependent DNA helicase RecG